jgi:hypothetical protein
VAGAHPTHQRLNEPSAADAADVRRRISEAGERRLQGLAIADSALHDVADVVPEALEAGLTKEEIAELVGVSRLTLDAVMRRRRQDEEFHAQMRRQLEDIRVVLEQLGR